MFKRLLLLVFVLVILAACAAWYSVGRPYKGYGTEAFVDIPPRTSTGDMAAILRKAGVIQADWQFMAARALRRGAKLQAGEYKFDRPMSPLDVYAKIARGDVFYYELRVPEGATMFDIGAELERLKLIKQDEFLAAAKDTTPIKDVAPNALTLEGYLFPSTYRITRATTAKQITREMVNQFRKTWTKLGGGEGTEVNRTVTLASLVEKETGIPAERPTVASVYHNRLRQGIKLDCDPTVIYAALLEGRYRGTIYRSDLDNPHPYNTYQNPGLPPGPIANPGAESLKAALHPAETRYLFFVARPDGSGGHTFSESIAAHNIAVQQYRNGQAAAR